MATTTAKKVNSQKKSKDLKGTLKNIHDEALKASDNLVEGSLATGAKWQTIMAKALTQGTVIFGKQQDLAFDTLAELKGQYISGTKRFRKLLGFGFPKVKEVVRTKKTKTVKATKSTAKAVKATTKKAIAKAVPTVKVVNDKLTKIEGVGPKIATLLNQAGITTYAQVAKTNIKDLKAILHAAGPRYKMHDPKTWRVQAKRLMK